MLVFASHLGHHARVDDFKPYYIHGPKFQVAVEQSVAWSRNYGKGVGNYSVNFKEIYLCCPFWRTTRQYY